MKQRPAILWAAWGLNPRLTGVERLVVAAVQACREAGLVTDAHPGTLVVDADAEWTAPFRDDPAVRLIAAPRVARRLIRPPRQVPAARVVHSFGALPPRSQGARIYTVHDFGPFTDRALPRSARVLWSVAMLAGLATADLVHTTGDLTAEDAPAWARHAVRRSTAWVRAAATAGPADVPLTQAEQQRVATVPAGAVLAVGTAAPRKQLPLLVDAAALAGVPLVLAGGGTETFGTGRGVVALGRCSDAEIAALYARCGATALISSYEGLGLTAVEGARHGKRCLVTAAVQRRQPPEVGPYLRVVHDEPTAAEVAAALTSLVALPSMPVLRYDSLGPLLDSYERLLAGSRAG